MTNAGLVHYVVEGGVGVITVDNPPVNALSPGVPEGILAAVADGEADPSVRAFVLLGGGKGFIGGADIRQFGKGAKRPEIGERIFDRLDTGTKPIVAAIHGHALGGGLEVALSCHYRLASSSARLGVPEINLGLIPGGGATQRLPRIVGAESALSMVTSGRHIKADEAERIGLIDRVLAEGDDLRQSAIAFAREMAGLRPLPNARLREVQVPADPSYFADLFAKARANAARRSKGQPAPLAAIDAVEAGVSMPFPQGLALERELFGRLLVTPESRALRYAFFAERSAARIPDGVASVDLSGIKTVGIVGAGTMGGGIAMCFAEAGVPVLLLDTSQDNLDRGLKRIADNYETAIRRGSATREAVETRLGLIRPVLSYDAFAHVDLVIEAAFEDLEVKRGVFRELDRVTRADALLMTNTSTISVDEIGGELPASRAIAGAHFFSPANVMKLLEVVEGARSTPSLVASAMRIGKQIGKVPVWSGNCDGFIANRSRGPMSQEAAALLEQGALPEQVDRVMTRFGFAMGPFAVTDLAGLDIGWAIRKRRKEADPSFRSNPIADRLCEMGRFGQKARAGWYRYEEGDRTPLPDPVVAEVIRQVAGELGIVQRAFADEEILHRLLFASVNEACRILDEKIARRASDIDVMWLNGFGFPRHRGGIMFWADTIGAATVYDSVRRWHQQYGPTWTPADLLRRTAEADGKLSEIVAGMA